MRRLLSMAALGLATLVLLTGCIGGYPGFEAILSPGEADGMRKALSLDDVDQMKRVSATLFVEAVKREEKNTVISPASMIVALGMACSGASGETQREFEALFGMDAADIRALCETLVSSYSIDLESFVLHLENALWIDDAVTLSEPCQTEPASPSFSEVYQGNLQRKGAGEGINRWVHEKTLGKIGDIVKAEELTEESRAVLTSAIYLDASWLSPFSASDTHDSAFAFEDGNQTTVPFMKSDLRSRRVIWTDEAEGVLFPYAETRFSLLIVRPRADVPIHQWAATMTETSIDELLEAAVERQSVVELPKFQHQYELSFQEILENMGIQSAFYNEADFSKMTEEGSELSLSMIKQKVSMEVLEKGTVAAAATNQFTPATAATSGGRLKFDSPFLYAVIDEEFNLPLLWGVVDRP